MRQQVAEYTRQDNRGSLVQLATGNWKQINAIFINKGKSFGKHYHKEKEELFIIFKGEIKLTIGKGLSKNNYYFHTGESFVVEARNFHIIKAIEDTQMAELITEPYSKEDTYV